MLADVLMASFIGFIIFLGSVAVGTYIADKLEEDERLRNDY